MLGVNKKAQNWSLEIIIALSVFLVIFVLVSVFMFYVPDDRTRALNDETEGIVSTLENGVLLEGDDVIIDGADELSTYTCEDLQDLFSISGEVCIHFENLDGTLVRVNGKTGFGCEGISLNDDGLLCGGSSS